jgi:hypothetical protein
VVCAYVARTSARGSGEYTSCDAPTSGLKYELATVMPPSRRPPLRSNASWVMSVRSTGTGPPFARLRLFVDAPTS